MIYYDRVYGKTEINEPIVLELLSSPTFQRLQHIDLGGYRPLWAKPGHDISETEHSRFSHSVGVYLLLRKYGACLEEQISGLIHDVSHSAFSHCIDYVLEGGSAIEQSYQDTLFEQFVKKSDIPKILQNHGLDVSYIIDDTHFPLKEKDLPDLCADRIDYSLRTAVLFHEITFEEAQEFLDNLTVYEGKWVFKNFSIAQRFTKLFSLLNQKFYAGLDSAVMFLSVGNCLRHALTQKYICEADLYTTDHEVVTQIQQHIHNDAKLLFFWECMHKKRTISLDSGTQANQIFCKSRAIDPLWIGPNGIKHISDSDFEWKNSLHIERKPKEYWISFS